MNCISDSDDRRHLGILGGMDDIVCRTSYCCRPII